MISASGAPNVQPIYLALRKFLAATTTLDIDFSVRDVFLPVVAKLEAVGTNHSSTWDPLFLKVLLARESMAHTMEIPKAILLTLASDLGAYATAESLLQSLRSAPAAPLRCSGEIQAVRAECRLIERQDEFPEPQWDLDEPCGVLAVGSRRYLPTVCPSCGKPGTEGSDYMTCCSVWTFP